MTSTQTKHQLISPLLISLLLFTLSRIPQANSLTSLPTRLIQPLYSPISQLGTKTTKPTTNNYLSPSNSVRKFDLKTRKHSTTNPDSPSQKSTPLRHHSLSQLAFSTRQNHQSFSLSHCHSSRPFSHTTRTTSSRLYCSSGYSY